MNSTKKIFLYALLTLLASCLPIFMTVIITDLGKLFELEMINDLSFNQVLGFALIFNLIFNKNNIKNNKKEEYEDNIKEHYIKIMRLFLYYLISWGMAYLYFFLLK